MSSCAGYHTPIEDEVAGDGISDLPSDLGLLTSRGGSFLHTQVHLVNVILSLSNIDITFSCVLGSFSKLCYNDGIPISRCIFRTDEVIVWITSSIRTAATWAQFRGVVPCVFAFGWCMFNAEFILRILAKISKNVRIFFVFKSCFLRRSSLKS